MQVPFRRCPLPCLPWALAGVSATTKYGDGQGADARNDAHFEAGGPGDSSSDMTSSLTAETCSEHSAECSLPPSPVTAVHESSRGSAILTAAKWNKQVNVDAAQLCM